MFLQNGVMGVVGTLLMNSLKSWEDGKKLPWDDQQLTCDCLSPVQ